MMIPRRSSFMTPGSWSSISACYYRFFSPFTFVLGDFVVDLFQIYISFERYYHIFLIDRLRRFLIRAIKGILRQIRMRTFELVTCLSKINKSRRPVAKNAKNAKRDLNRTSELRVDLAQLARQRLRNFLLNH